MAYVYKKIISDIVCNICGLTCKDKHNMNYEFVAIDVTWGYGSSKDMVREVAHICERCYDNKVFPLFTLPTTEVKNKEGEVTSLGPKEITSPISEEILDEHGF